MRHYQMGKIEVVAWMDSYRYPHFCDLVVDAAPSYMVLRYHADKGEFRIRLGIDDDETMSTGKSIHLFDLADLWSSWRPDAVKDSKLKAEAEVAKICKDEFKFGLADATDSKESKKRKHGTSEDDQLVHTRIVYDLLDENRRETLIKDLTEDGQEGLVGFDVDSVFGVSKWNVHFVFETLDRKKKKVKHV